MTDDEFDTTMLAVTGVWPNWQANQATFGVAERLLAGLAYEDVVAAVDALAIESPRWFPGLGELRVRALELGQPEGGAPSGDEAWGEVVRERHRAGQYAGTALSDRSATFSHRAITVVVEAMGWAELCTSQNEVADRAHFLKLYAERVTRLRVDRATPPSVAAAIARAAGSLALPAGVR